MWETVLVEELWPSDIIRYGSLAIPVTHIEYTEENVNLYHQYSKDPIHFRYTDTVSRFERGMQGVAGQDSDGLASEHFDDSTS